MGGFLQLAFQLPFLRRNGIRLRPAVSFSDPGLRRVGLLMVPGLFGVAVYQINLIVDAQFASFLGDGSVSWLYYADRINELVLGVFAISLSTVVLPTLSRQVVDGEPEKVRQTLSLALRLIAFITIPATLGLIVLRVPIVRVLFERGEFTAVDSAATAQLALEHGFHGRTSGALAVTHDPGLREPFGPLLPGVHFVPGDDEDALAVALRERPAALILEPIQGEGGVRELSGSFLRRARALCDETATVLIHDEVQCGAGRTGTFLAAEAAGVRPDVVALAKPLAGGLPMGATLVRRELAATLGPGDHGSTFGGGPLACRAALVVLDALADGLQENVRARGAELGAGLERIAAEFETVLEVRGRGLMRGLRLSSEAAPLRDELYRAGLLVGEARDVLRFLPPYVITATDVERALELVRQGLRDVSQP